jgi:hypothetical protein
MATRAARGGRMNQPIYPLVLTHDEIIALAGALDLLRETLLAQKKLSVRDLTTVKNIESVASKLPDEAWFEEVTSC